MRFYTTIFLVMFYQKFGIVDKAFGQTVSQIPARKYVVKTAPLPLVSISSLCTIASLGSLRHFDHTLAAQQL